MRRTRRLPNDRAGWFRYYLRRDNSQAQQLAGFYQLLLLSEGNK